MVTISQHFPCPFARAAAFCPWPTSSAAARRLRLLAAANDTSLLVPSVSVDYSLLNVSPTYMFHYRLTILLDARLILAAISKKCDSYPTLLVYIHVRTMNGCAISHRCDNSNYIICINGKRDCKLFNCK